MIPRDDVVNFFWIGSKPLPNDELKTLISYATPGILPVVLWADNPNKMRSQVEELGFKSLLERENLQIEPISRLFETDNGVTKVERDYDRLLDALQSREKVGEGNIGTRVDILKIQAAYKTGGLVIDFDTAEQMLKKNTTSLAEDCTEVLNEIKRWQQPRKLLFKTATAELDVIVSISSSEDAQLLRETLVNNSVRNTKINYEISNSFEDPDDYSPPPIPALPAKDPLYHLKPDDDSNSNDPREYHENVHDIRRSYRGWTMPMFNMHLQANVPISKDIVMSQDTGKVLAHFLEVKKSKIFQQSPLYALYEEKTALQHSLEEETNLAEEEKMTVRIEEIEELLTPEVMSNTAEEHDLQAYVSENFVLVTNVFTHSWDSKSLEKPAGYTEEGKEYKRPPNKPK